MFGVIYAFSGMIKIFFGGKDTKKLSLLVDAKYKGPLVTGEGWAQSLGWLRHSGWLTRKCKTRLKIKQQHIVPISTIQKGLPIRV